jgi:glycosyltransferase involved in cell wall biosynthesis
VKVLVVSDGILPPSVYCSGVSAVYNIQRALKALGADVHILTCYDSWTSPYWREWISAEKRKTGISIHCLYMKMWNKFPNQSFLMSRILYFFEALKLHSQYRFDIIHEYSSSPLLFFRTGAYKMLTDIHSVHTLATFKSGLLGSSRLSNDLGFVDKIICSSKYMAEELMGLKRYRKKVAYIPLGIDISRFSKHVNGDTLIDKLQIPPNSPVILYIGPFESRKGFFLLMEAAKNVIKDFPNVVFILVTPGSRDSLHESFYVTSQVIKGLIGEHERSFRIVKGIVDVPSYMSIADIFVLPQTTPNGTLGQPLTLLEAMASGKNIVASRTLGITDLIQHGQNGLLFSSGNAHDLAEKIRLLLYSKEKMFLGEHARETVKAFDQQTVAQKLMEIYREISSK